MGMWEIASALMDGQKRRQWLDRQDAKLTEGVRYYGGPAADPVMGIAKLLGAATPGADMMDMAQSSQDLMASRSPMEAAKNAGWLGASTLGMALPGNVGMLREGAEEVAQAAPKGIRAYHGSPHDFDKFSLDKIGTGEGAQAYGHGLYFAEGEDVAKSYRDKLSRQVTVGGAPLSTHPMDNDMATAQHSIAGRVADGVSPEDAIRQEAAGWREHAAMYRDAAEKDPSISDLANQEAASFESIAAKIEAQNPADFVKNPGHMYEVNIDANPEDFLDWDKPLSEQSEKVRAAVQAEPPQAIAAQRAQLEAKVNVAQRRAERAYETGQDTPEMFTEIRKAEFELEQFSKKFNPSGAAVVAGMGPKEEAAQALRAAGIPGIKYLDQGSRGAGGGSRNYVVFSPEMISILRKYGLLGAVGAGGAALGAASQTPPDEL
jgi:hypothetical protein